MTMKLKKGYILWKDLEKKLMKDPAFRREAERQEPEYQMARALIGARIKKKLSQKALAKKIGTKQPVVSRIESMATLPTVRILKRLADALDMRLSIRFLPK